MSWRPRKTVPFRQMLAWSGFLLGTATSAFPAAPLSPPRPTTAPTQPAATGPATRLVLPGPDLPAELAEFSKAGGGGLWVHLGCTDGRLTLALAQGGRFVVQGLAGDPAKVEGARQYIRSQGAYGPVSVDQADLKSLPYVDNLVNVVVVDDWEKAGTSLDEILRVLRPGGSALLRGTGDGGKNPARPGVTVQDKGGGWRMVTKPPQPDVDDWPALEHDAGRSSVSADKLAGRPEGLQWLAGDDQPLTGPGFAAAGGRNYYWAPDTSRSSLLFCRDSYNGMLLWQMALAFPVNPSLMWATTNRLYLLTNGSRVQVLDAATSRLEAEYPFGQTPGPLLFSDGLLLAYYADGSCKAVDANSGQLVWEKKFLPQKRPGTDLLVAGDGKVFYLAREAAGQPMTLFCCELTTGRQVWSTPADLKPEAKDSPSALYWYRRGILMLGTTGRFSGSGQDIVIRAVEGRDGQTLWDKKIPISSHKGMAGNILYVGPHIWIKTLEVKDRWLVVDPRTGRQEQSFPANQHCCYPDHATGRFILGGHWDVLDVATGQAGSGYQGLFRSSCRTGFIPANGMIYTQPTRCRCAPFLHGYLALKTAPALGPKDPIPPAGERLEKGPAYAAAPKLAEGTEDWPTLRHDGSRSGSTAAVLPTNLIQQWDTRTETDWTSPVIAAGKVFVASSDTHAVTALNAIDGQPVWTFTTGGRVDSPPTFHAGRLIFGANDGWVYCLDAADGRLAWRFRAAPTDRRIVVREQVESAWPVHGSTLAENGVAYCWAGRHTLCDGGLWVYALDIKTGQVLWQKRFTGTEGVQMATLPLKDGTTLRLGNKWQMDLGTGAPVQADGSLVWCPTGLLADQAHPPDTGFLNFRAQWAYVRVPASSPWASMGIQQAYVGKANYGATKAVRGQILAYDQAGVYGVRQDPESGRSEAFRADLNGGLQMASFGKGSPATMMDGDQWAVQMPPLKEVALQAVVVAGDRMLVGGEMIGGARNGQGLLLVLATKDGKQLAEIPLPAAPRWDGLAVADGKVLVSTQAGRVICLGSK